MTPPTSIDGTDITGATIDGTDVTEITVDGETVFTALPPIPDSVATHQWNGDEGSGTTLADSIGSLDGSINGATWESGEGAGDFYLDYDGTDDFTALTGGASELTHFTNSATGTFFAWIKPSSINDNGTIFGNAVSGNDVGCAFLINDAEYILEIYAGGGTGSSIATIKNVPYGGLPDSWRPVAFTIDGSTLRLFEGDPMVQVSSDSASGGTASNWTRNPNIGMANPGVLNFSGGIDLVWIDDIARSQSGLQSFIDDSKAFYP